DHLGPQLHWWAWNPRVPYNRVALGTVPLVSMVIFAIVAPAALVYLWRLLVAEPEERGATRGARLALRTLLAGALAPVLMSLVGTPLSLPLTVPHPHYALGAALLYAALVMAGVVTVHALAGAPPRTVAARGDRFSERYPLWHGAAFLAAFAALWL